MWETGLISNILQRANKHKLAATHRQNHLLENSFNLHKHLFNEHYVKRTNKNVDPKTPFIPCSNTHSFSLKTHIWITLTPNCLCDDCRSVTPTDDYAGSIIPKTNACCGFYYSYNVFSPLMLFFFFLHQSLFFLVKHQPFLIPHFCVQHHPGMWSAKDKKGKPISYNTYYCTVQLKKIKYLISIKIIIINVYNI